MNMSVKEIFLSGWKTLFPSDAPPDLPCLDGGGLGSTGKLSSFGAGGTHASPASNGIDRFAVERSLKMYNENIAVYTVRLQQQEFVANFLWELLHSDNRPFSLQQRTAYAPLSSQAAPASPASSGRYHAHGGSATVPSRGSKPAAGTPSSGANLARSLTSDGVVRNWKKAEESEYSSHNLALDSEVPIQDTYSVTTSPNSISEEGGYYADNTIISRISSIDSITADASGNRDDIYSNMCEIKGTKSFHKKSLPSVDIASSPGLAEEDCDRAHSLDSGLYLNEHDVSESGKRDSASSTGKTSGRLHGQQNEGLGGASNVGHFEKHMKPRPVPAPRVPKQKSSDELFSSSPDFSSNTSLGGARSSESLNYVGTDQRNVSDHHSCKYGSVREVVGPSRLPVDIETEPGSTKATNGSARKLINKKLASSTNISEKSAGGSRSNSNERKFLNSENDNKKSVKLTRSTDVRVGDKVNIVLGMNDAQMLNMKIEGVDDTSSTVRIHQSLTFCT